MASITEKASAGQTVFTLPLHAGTATATVNGSPATISAQSNNTITLSTPCSAGDTVAITYTPVYPDQYLEATPDPATGLSILDDASETAVSLVKEGAAAGSRPTALIVGNSIGQQSQPTINPDLATTYAASGADAGQKVINVNTGGGASFSNGDKVAIQLFTGEIQLNTVASVSTDAVTFTDNLLKFVRSGAGFGSLTKYTANKPSVLNQGMGIVSASNALLGSPMKITQGFSMGGARFVDIMRALEKWLVTKRPNLVFFSGLFENDLGGAGSTTYALFVERTKMAARLCLRYGATPIFQGIVPAGTNYISSTSQAQVYDNYNSYVTSQLWSDVPGAYGYSCLGWLADPTRASTTQRQPIASYVEASPVAIHPLVNKRFAVALASNSAGPSVASQIGAILTRLGYNPNLNELFSGGLLSNPLLTGTAGGDISSGGGSISGIVPSGDFLGGIGAGVSVVASRNADGSVKLVGTITTATNSKNVTYRKAAVVPASANTLGTDGAQGGRALVKVKINALTNMDAIYPKHSFNSGVDCYSTAGATFGTAGDTALIGQTITLETADVAVPDAATGERVDIIFQPTNGAGSASFDIDLYGISLLPGAPHTIV